MVINTPIYDYQLWVNAVNRHGRVSLNIRSDYVIATMDNTTLGEYNETKKEGWVKEKR